MMRASLILALTIGALGCTPWYAKYGIKSESQLTDPAYKHRLKPAVLSPSADAYHAIQALEKMGQPAVPVLVLGLGNAFEYHRRYAAGVLGQIASPEAVPALLAALSDPDDEVRLLAIEALKQIGDRRQEVLDALAAVGADDPEKDVRAAAKVTRQVLLIGGTKNGPRAGKVGSRAPKGAIVAVFDIEDGGLGANPETLNQLTDYLTTRLTQVGGLRVIPREQIRKRLVQQRAQSYKSCYQRECQIEIGKALAAQQSVATRLLRVGGRCAVASQIYDLKTEAAEAAASVKTACFGEALFEAIDRVVDQLFGGAK